MTSSLQVVSLSSIPAGVRIWRSRRRGLANVIACKATYQLIAPEMELAAEQDPLTAADEFWDNDAMRSLRAPTDWAPYKRRADVILVGSAYAPSGTQVRRLVTCINVAGMEKIIEVRCDRWVAHDGSVQEGAAFARMPLQWERAGGGGDTGNPVGMRPERDSFGKLALPNLRPIGFEPAGPDWYVPPVGFGPIPPSWPSRAAALGSYAKTWTDRWIEAGLPDDLDFGFFQAAPRDQQLETLPTDAQIRLENLHPNGDRFQTQLPGHRARAIVEPESLEVEMVCDTLVIDTDRLVATLTWRGSFWSSDCPHASRVILALEVTDNPMSVDALVELAAPGDDTVNLGTKANAGSVVALPFSPAVAAPRPVALPPADGPLPSFETAELMAAGEGDASLIEDPSTESRFDMSPPPPPPSIPPPVVPPPPVVHKTQQGLGLVPPPPPSAIRRLSSGPPNPIEVKPPPPTNGRPAPPPPPKRAAPADSPTKAPPKTLVDLLWYAHGALAKIRGSSEIAARIGDKHERAGDPDRVVGRVLTRVAPLDRAGVRSAVLASVDDEGLLVRPLVVIEGELELTHEPLEILRATVALETGPGAKPSKDLEAKIRAAEDLLREERPATNAMIDDALAALKKARGVSAQNDAAVARMMLEERKWSRRAIVGGMHLVGRVHRKGSKPIVAYLPEEAGSRLPLLQKFPVRLLVEPHLRQEEGAQDDLAVVIVALARTAELSFQT